MASTSPPRLSAALDFRQPLCLGLGCSGSLRRGCTLSLAGRDPGWPSPNVRIVPRGVSDRENASPRASHAGGVHKAFPERPWGRANVLVDNWGPVTVRASLTAGTQCLWY